MTFPADLINAVDDSAPGAGDGTPIVAALLAPLGVRYAKEVWVGDTGYGTTIQGAVLVLDTTPARLRVAAGAWSIPADHAIPDNIILCPEPGAVITIGTGATLTTRLAAAFAPHEQGTPDMTVRVDAGALFVSGAIVEVAAQDTAAITAPSSDPRIDRVVIDILTGVVSVVTGTEDPAPDPPDIPTGKLPVCQVALETTTAAIDNTMLTDERICGGGGGEAFAVNGLYLEVLGVNPATTLGYGTWELVNLLGLNHSAYPPAYNSTYVKATSSYGTYYPHLTTNPSVSLIGTWGDRQWMTDVVTNRRFHIDLGSAQIITRVYYENSHSSGTLTDAGAKNFTLWGSNNAAAFAELTYGTDTNWTQLTCSATQLVQHPASDVADPHYFNVSDVTAYRYYAFKFADNWGNASYLGVRRIELQTADIYDWKRAA